MTDDKLMPIDADGLVYGLGAEFKVTDKVTVGLEYLRRDLVSDHWVEFPNFHVEADFPTIALRIGYRF